MPSQQVSNKLRPRIDLQARTNGRVFVIVGVVFVTPPAPYPLSLKSLLTASLS